MFKLTDLLRDQDFAMFPKPRQAPAVHRTCSSVLAPSGLPEPERAAAPWVISQHRWYAAHLVWMPNVDIWAMARAQSASAAVARRRHSRFSQRRSLWVSGNVRSCFPRTTDRTRSASSRTRQRRHLPRVCRQARPPPARQTASTRQRCLRSS